MLCKRAMSSRSPRRMTAKQVSHTDASSANKLIGAFLLTKTNGQTVARVRLNGTTGS